MAKNMIGPPEGGAACDCDEYNNPKQDKPKPVRAGSGRGPVVKKPIGNG